MEDHQAYEYTPLAAGSQIRLIKLLPGACHADIEVEIFTTDLDSLEGEAAMKDKLNGEIEEPNAWSRQHPRTSKHPKATKIVSCASQILRRWSQRTRTVLERFWKTPPPDVETASSRPGISKLKHLHWKSYVHKYDALSYTWGTNTNRIPILVKGETGIDDTRSFSVTRNLGIALRYLRDTESTKILWIDALCINQADCKEKSRQVSMMTRIYKNANQVTVWLGPAADNSDMAMKELKNKCNTIGSITEDNRQLRRSLESLARREYWTRVWVVQEIFVGSAVKIMCGTFEADWDSTTETFKSFLDARNALLKADEPSLPPLEFSTYQPSPSNNTRTLDPLPLKTISTLDTNRSLAVDKRGPDWLLEMLLHIRHFGATDPRDKIFSMLGLLSSQDLLKGKGYNLRADYGRTFLDVSVQLFKFCFLAPRRTRTLHQRELGRLNIISASQPDSSSKFPTWLPDFSKDNGMQPWPRLKKLGGNLQTTVKMSRNNRIISVIAIKVAELVARTSSKDDCLATDDLSLLARLQHSTMEVSTHLTYSRDTSREFWSSLVLGDDVGSKLSDVLYKSTSSFQQELNEIVSNVLSEDESRGSNQSRSRSAQVISLSRTYLDVFRRQAYFRRFAVFKPSMDWKSRDGFVEVPTISTQDVKVPAMVPENAKVGDRLYRLGDCDYLVLLRPRVANGEPYFNFIGPCYLTPPETWIDDSPVVKEGCIAIH